MKLSPNTIEEIKVFGTLIKELTKEKDSAFQEFSSLKDILTPLKELASGKGFAELSGIKDICTPVKELVPKDEGKDEKGKDEKSSKQEDKKGKDEK